MDTVIDAAPPAEDEELLAPPPWEDVEADEEFKKLSPAKKQVTLSNWTQALNRYAKATGQFEDAANQDAVRGFVKSKAAEYASQWGDAVSAGAYDDNLLGQTQRIADRAILGAEQIAPNAIALGNRIAEFAVEAPGAMPQAMDAIGLNKISPSESVRKDGFSAAYREFTKPLREHFRGTADYAREQTNEMGQAGAASGGGVVGEVAQALPTAAAEAVQDMAMAMSTGGASLPEQVGAKYGAAAMRGLNVSSIMAGIRSAIPTLDEAERQYMDADPTLTREQARMKAAPEALVSGASSALITKLGGLTGVESVLKESGAVGLRAKAVEVLKEALSEGIEEGADQSLQDLAERFYRNPNKAWSDTYKEIAMASALGAMLGGGMSGLSETVNTIAERANENNAPATAKVLREKAEQRAAQEAAVRTAELFGTPDDAAEARKVAEQFLNEDDGINESSPEDNAPAPQAPAPGAAEAVQQDGQGDAAAVAPAAASEQAAQTPVAPVAADDSVETGETLRSKYTGQDGAFDTEAASAGIQKNGTETLDAGGKVTLFADGKPVNIVGFRNGMMVDDKGQQWGGMGLFTGKTDANRIEFSKNTETPTQRDRPLLIDPVADTRNELNSPAPDVSGVEPIQVPKAAPAAEISNEGGEQNGQEERRQEVLSGQPENQTKPETQAAGATLPVTTAPASSSSFSTDPDTIAAQLQANPGKRIYVPDDVMDNEQLDDAKVSTAYDKDAGKFYVTGAVSEKLGGRVLESGAIEVTSEDGEAVAAEPPKAKKPSKQKGTGKGYHLKYVKPSYAAFIRQKPQSKAEIEDAKRIAKMPVEKGAEKPKGLVDRAYERIDAIAATLANETYRDTNDNVTPIPDDAVEKIAYAAKNLFLARLRGVEKTGKADPAAVVADIKADYLPYLSRQEGTAGSLNDVTGTDVEKVDRVEGGLNAVAEESPSQTQAQQDAETATAEDSTGPEVDNEADAETNEPAKATYSSVYEEVMAEVVSELSEEDLVHWGKAAPKMAKGQKFSSAEKDQKRVAEMVKSRALAKLQERMSKEVDVDPDEDMALKPQAAVTPDRQEALIQQNIKDIAELFDGETSVQAVLKKIADNPRVPQWVRTNARLASAFDFSGVDFVAVANRTRSSDWAGLYTSNPDPKQGTISINVAADHIGGPAVTIVHEAFHHLMLHKLADGYPLNETERAAVGDLKKILRHLQKENLKRQRGRSYAQAAMRSVRREQGGNLAYALTNLDELVSVMMSDPEFHRWVNGLDAIEGLSVNQGRVGFWKKLGDQIRAVFTRFIVGSNVRPGSLLEQAVANVLTLAADLDYTDGVVAAPRSAASIPKPAAEGVEPLRKGFDFKVKIAIDKMVEGRGGELKGLTPAPDGTVPWENLAAKVRKSFNLAEAETVIPVLENLVSKGRVKVADAAEALRALADVSARVVELPANIDEEKPVTNRAEVSHQLDTMYPGWEQDDSDYVDDESYMALRDEYETLTQQQYHGWRERKPEVEAATGRYTMVNPKPLEQMEDAKDITIEEPVLGEEKFSEQIHFPTRKNVIGFGRMYTETLPSGEKATFVFEVQSDWASDDRKNAEAYAADLQSRNETGRYEGVKRDPSSPLLSVYETLVLKAAIQDALAKGQTKLVVTDAETAMMTERHDTQRLEAAATRDVYSSKKAPISVGEYGVRYSNGTIRVFDTEADAKAYAERDKWSDPSERGRVDRVASQDLIKPRPSQEPGMRAAYNPATGRLHNIMRKLTGDRGAKVDLGVHQNATKPGVRTDTIDEGILAGSEMQVEDRQKPVAVGSPVFKNADGTPKTNITGIVYDLSKIAKNPEKVQSLYAQPSKGAFQGTHPQASRAAQLFEKAQRSPHIQYTATKLGDHPAEAYLTDDDKIGIVYDPDVIANEIEGYSDEEAERYVRALVEHEEMHGAGLLADFFIPDEKGRLGSRKAEAFHDELMTQKMREDTADYYVRQHAEESDEAFKQRRADFLANKRAVAGEYKRMVLELLRNGNTNEDIMAQIADGLGDNALMRHLKGLADYVMGVLRWASYQFHSTFRPKIGVQLRADLRALEILMDRSGKPFDKLLFAEDLRSQSEYLLKRVKQGKYANLESVPEEISDRWMEEWRIDHPRNLVDGIERASAMAASDATVKRFNELTKDLQGRKLTQADLDAWRQANPGKYAELEGLRAEVLRSQGYTVEAWHGTPNNEFTVFDMGRDRFSSGAVLGRGAYFTPDQTVAKQYLGNGTGRLIHAMLRVRTPLDLRSASFTELNDLAIGLTNTANPGVRFELTGKEGWDEVIIASGERNAGSYRFVKNSDGTYRSRGFTSGVRQERIGASLIRAAKSLGYDGVAAPLGDAHLGHTQIIVNDPSQIKSADPLNLDSNGNLIPPSQWGDAKSPDIRYAAPVTPQMDRAYFDAVKKYGEDSPEVEKLVREAAAKAGYTVEAWHGTKTKGEFPNTLNPSGYDVVGGIFLGLDRDTAAMYSRNIKRLFAKSEKPYRIELKFDRDGEYVGDDMPIGYAHAGGSLEWDAEKLRADGYDSALRADNELIVFSPEQIKSADPVTRDAQGNIIPLSKRFNPREKDIRYASTTGSFSATRGMNHAQVIDHVMKVAKNLFGVSVNPENRAAYSKNPDAVFSAYADLNTVAGNAKKMFPEFSELVDRFVAKAPEGLQVRVTHGDTFARPTGELGGFYDPETNTISINLAADGTIPFFIHELSHAATEAAIRNPITAAQREAVRELNLIGEYLRSQSDKIPMLSSYGGDLGYLTDPHELVAHIYSSGEFRNMLDRISDARIPGLVTKPRTSLLQRVFDAFAKALGFRPEETSLLTKVLEATDALTAGAEKANPLPGGSVRYAAPTFRKKPKVNNGGWKASGPLGQGDMDMRVFDRLAAKDAEVRSASYRVKETTRRYEAAVKKLKPDLALVRMALGTTDNKLTDVQQEQYLKLRRKDAAAAEAFRTAEIQANTHKAKLERQYALGQLPAEMVDVIEQMRSDIDRLSNVLISTGMVSSSLQTTVSDNLEIYLNRSYEIFDNPEYANFVRTDMSPATVALRNRALTFLKGQAIAQKAKEIRRLAKLAGTPVPTRASALATATATITPEEVQNLFDSYLEVADDHAITMLGSKMPGKKNFDILTLRGQIPEPIRALWGEYTDPGINYAKSYMKLSSFIAEHNFQKDLLDMGLNGPVPFLWKAGAPGAGATHPQGWVPIYGGMTDKPHSNPMAGVYGPKIIKEAFDDLRKQYKHNVVNQIVSTFTGFAMASKTVYNIPQSNTRNFLGNGLIMLANGYLTQDAKFIKRFKKSLQTTGATMVGLRAGDGVGKMKIAEQTKAVTDYVERMIRLGIMGDNVKANVVKELTSVVFDRDPETAFGKKAAATFRAAKDLNERAVEAYGAGDDFWKIVAFETERDLMARAFPKATAEEIDRMAADRVVNKVPTYSRIPKVVKDVVKGQPYVAPFISWTSEILRTTYNTLRMNYQDARSGNPVLKEAGIKGLISFLAAQAILPAAALVVRSLAGLTDDDEEDLRRFLPEWQKDALLMMFKKTGDGKVSFVDLSFLDPYSVLKEPVIAAVNAAREENDAVSAVWRMASTGVAKTIEPWTAEQLFFGAVVDVLRGVDKNGKPLYEKADSGWNKATISAGRVANSLVPGTINIVRRIAAAASGEVGAGGKSFNMFNEMAGPLVGQRLTEIDPAQSFQLGKIGEFQRMDRSAKVLATKAYSNRGSIDNSKVAEQYVQANTARMGAFKALRKDIDAMRNLGVPDDTIRRLLGGSNIPKDTIDLVLKGYYKKYVPSNDTIEEGSLRPNGMERYRALIEAIKSYPEDQRITDE